MLLDGWYAFVIQRNNNKCKGQMITPLTVVFTHNSPFNLKALSLKRK